MAASRDAGSVEGQLRSARRSLFDGYTSIDSLQRLAGFQRQLANEIISAESLKSGAERDPARDLAAHHMQLLRRYGDALAWSWLHPFVIRQLSSSPSPRPAHLSSQAEAVDQVLKMIDRAADQHVPALMCDVTNVLQIGDIVVASKADEPLLLEAKSDRLYAVQRGLGEGVEVLELRDEAVQSRPPMGRVARQLTRMTNVVDYLHDGVGQFFDHDETLVTVVTDHEPDFVWDAVEEVVRKAMNEGQAFTLARDGHLIMAGKAELDSEYPERVIRQIAKMKRPRLGCHLRAEENGWWFAPPPHIWPLDPDLGWPLVEGDIVVCSLVDLSLLVADPPSDMEIEFTEFEGEERISIRHEGAEQLLGDRWVYDLIYGYHSVESVRREIVASVRKQVQMLESGEYPKEKMDS